MPVPSIADLLQTLRDSGRLVPSTLDRLQALFVEPTTVTPEQVAEYFHNGVIFFINPSRAATEFGPDSWQANPQLARCWNRLLDAMIVKHLTRTGFSRVLAERMHALPEHPHDENVDYERRRLLNILRHVLWSEDWR